MDFIGSILFSKMSKSAIHAAIGALLSGKGDTFYQECLLFFFNVMYVCMHVCIYLFLRERASMSGEGREGETEDPKWALPDSKEPNVGLKLTNHEIMT